MANERTPPGGGRGRDHNPSGRGAFPHAGNRDDGGGTSRDALPSWNDLALPLPTRMAEAITAQSLRPSDADNVGLWMDKLVHRSKYGWQLEKNVRRFCLQQLCRKWTSALGQAAAERLAEVVPLLHRTHRSGTAKLQSRLLIGQGRAAATETSLTFHPVWGVPVIPGSALKGLARAALVEELSNDELRELFGDNERAGRLTFYDAVPLRGQFTLALDGQTPHHGRYYGTTSEAPDEPPLSARVTSTAPTDADSPVPFSFLTVVKTDFALHVAVHEERSAESDESQSARRKRDQGALDKVWRGLEQALRDLGLGGKTSAGYGRFGLEDANSAKR